MEVPVEILTKILSEFNVGDEGYDRTGLLLSASLTCKAWRSVAQRLLWERITLKQRDLVGGAALSPFKKDLYPQTDFNALEGSGALGKYPTTTLTMDITSSNSYELDGPLFQPTGLWGVKKLHLRFEHSLTKLEKFATVDTFKNLKELELEPLDPDYLAKDRSDEFEELLKNHPAPSFQLQSLTINDSPAILSINEIKFLLLNSRTSLRSIVLEGSCEMEAFLLNPILEEGEQEERSFFSNLCELRLPYTSPCYYDFKPHKSLRRMIVTDGDDNYDPHRLTRFRKDIFPDALEELVFDLRTHHESFQWPCKYPNMDEPSREHLEELEYVITKDLRLLKSLTIEYDSRCSNNPAFLEGRDLLRKWCAAGSIKLREVERPCKGGARGTSWAHC